MHYYKRNLGDYAKKAGRLSMLQHGAYTLLIDTCYDREQFPTLEEAIEWTWASTTEETEAVTFVLRKFFALEDGRYVQNRVREEIEAYHGMAETNKRIAIDREANRKEKDTNRVQDVDDSSSSGDESSPNHKPITNNHKPSKQSTASPRIGYPEKFEEAWSAYPSRPGSNKKSAFKAWNARINAGVDTEVILKGVVAYREYCDATKTQPKFIKQPQTFFGPDEHYLTVWSSSTGSLSSKPSIHTIATSADFANKPVVSDGAGRALDAPEIDFDETGIF